MTLKTLKQNPNFSLILDKEFIQYCELNNIEDIQKLAKEVFNQGFTILKYGETPMINLKTETKVVDMEVRKIKTKITQEMGKPEIVIPKEIRKEVEHELKKELKLNDKNNIYGE